MERLYLQGTLRSIASAEVLQQAARLRRVRARRQEEGTVPTSWPGLTQASGRLTRSKGRASVVGPRATLCCIGRHAPLLDAAHLGQSNGTVPSCVILIGILLIAWRLIRHEAGDKLPTTARILRFRGLAGGRCQRHRSIAAASASKGRSRLESALLAVSALEGRSRLAQDLLPVLRRLRRRHFGERIRRRRFRGLAGHLLRPGRGCEVLMRFAFVVILVVVIGLPAVLDPAGRACHSLDELPDNGPFAGVRLVEPPIEGDAGLVSPTKTRWWRLSDMVVPHGWEIE